VEIAQALNQLARLLAHLRIGRVFQFGDQFLDAAEPQLKFLAADLFRRVLY
jgi:hypothetical protein